MEYPDSAVTTAQMALPARAWAARRALLLQAAGVMGFAALTAVGAQYRLYLPFTPVPVTFQTAAVLLAGATLGPAGGTISQVLHLLAGAAGLPLFTTGATFGATSGYLLAFVPAAWLVGWCRRRWGWRGMVAGMLLGSTVIYAGGVLGLCTLTGISFAGAIATGVSPFLLGDALKLVAAAAVARLTIPAWRKLLDRHQ